MEPSPQPQPLAESAPAARTSGNTPVIVAVLALALLAGFLLYAQAPGTPFDSLPRLGGTETRFVTKTETLTKTMTDSVTVTSTATSRSTVIQLATTTVSTTTTLTLRAYSVPDPSILGGQAEITFPPDYEPLANSALQLINQDRAEAGAPPVTLSPSPIAQQHANSMLFFGYFSHWDTQGYKPYTRYTLLSGTGAVTENIGFFWVTGPTPKFSTTGEVEAAIRDLQWQMVNNDTVCCNDGHRRNILDPHHNRVAIGIAYNFTHMYFAQEFENYYIQFDEVSLAPDLLVGLRGIPLTRIAPTTIALYFDPAPILLSPAALSGPQYVGGYNTGSFIGGVFPPCSRGCPYYPDATTVYASAWRLDLNTLDLQFSLAPFVEKHGSGVYTVYLTDTNQRPLQEFTSISLFVR